MEGSAVVAWCSEAISSGSNLAGCLLRKEFREP